jgi:hypothetical protein
MTSAPCIIFPEKDEFTAKYKWSLTFTNGRVYNWDLSPIEWNVMWILEIEDGSFYTVRFSFCGWSCIDFREITDSHRSTTLLYWYTPKFWINSNMKPFDKEYVSKIFNFERYKNGLYGDVDIHLTFQHWIWMYDWDNIWYIPEWKWKLIYKNWDVYEWEFKKWIPEWKWKLIFNKYWIMEWEFKNWELTWKWVSSYPNRWEYRWEFYMGHPHWRWTIVYVNWERHRWKWEYWKFIW